MTYLRSGGDFVTGNHQMLRILILCVRPRQGSWYLPTHFWTLGVPCGERLSFRGPSSSLPANRFKPFWLKMEERYCQWNEGVTWGLVICNANLSVRLFQ